jgi:hypothetical protein
LTCAYARASSRTDFRSITLDAREPHDLAPLLSPDRDQLAKIRKRACRDPAIERADLAVSALFLGLTSL